jgi:hypothetical protein
MGAQKADKSHSYSFNLAYWPGQPAILCESQETSWSGYFSYTEGSFCCIACAMVT